MVQLPAQQKLVEHLLRTDSSGVDAHQLLLQLNVDEVELERRRAGWTKPEQRYRNDILGKYARIGLEFQSRCHHGSRG